MSALREAFVDELKDLLDAERQLLKALPTMAKAAENEQLRMAFEEHQQQTGEQIRRLGYVFEAFEESPQGIKCKGMEGLLKEAIELIEEEEGDAALIAAAQKAEHYEISAYGTLAAWAVALGQDDAAQRLNEILLEEREADKKLTMIAQTVVNSSESQREVEEGENPKPARRKSNPRAPKARRSVAPKRSAGGNRTARGRNSNRATANQRARSPRSKRMRAGARK